MKRGLLFVVAAVCAVCVGFPAQAQINEGFDGFQIGIRPSGWEFVNCDRNSDGDMSFYGVAAPGIRLGRVSRSRIVTGEFTQTGAVSLSFYLQAIAANPSSALQVRESDGATWSLLTWIDGPFNLGGATVTLALNDSSSQQVEIEYLKATGDGNAVVDDVALTNVSTAPTPVPPAPAPSPIYLVIADDDYDGDGSSNAAFYNPSGDWQLEGIGTESFGGGSEDVPAPGDYDGDGVADLGYFDRSVAEWYAQSVGGGAIISGEVWGVSGDVPVPGDYDGDGTTDLAVWRPSNGYWYVKNITSILYGYDGVIPAPGDYTGNGTTDIAVVDTAGFATWRWFVNGVSGSRAWGLASDIPVPGDYDGDGLTELGAYRSSNNRFWWIRRNGTGFGVQAWGIAGDVPVVGDFTGDGAADPTVFRAADSWIVYGNGTITLAPNESSAVIVTGATGY